ncbi:MAG: hypothetical protein U0892_14645 [Pirellulales bacterium]
MLSNLLNNSTLPALEQTISFAQRRHALLAGNLANMDTPDYKTRDISVEDFQKQLHTALTEPKPASQGYYSPGMGTVGQASAGSVSPGGSVASTAGSKSDGFEKVRDVSKQILFHDGHDVSLEEQVTEVAKNASMHNTAIALMRSQLSTLRAAITESANV